MALHHGEKPRRIDIPSIGNGICKQVHGNQPHIEDTHLIRKLRVNPGSYIDLQSQHGNPTSTDQPVQMFFSKECPYGNSVSTPHRRYGCDSGRRCADAVCETSARYEYPRLVLLNRYEDQFLVICVKSLQSGPPTFCEITIITCSMWLGSLGKFA